MMFMFTERTAVFLFFITLPYYVRNYSQHRLYHDRQHGRQCSQACHQASISKCIVSCHGTGSLSFGNQCRYFTFESNYPVLFIVSLALGTLVGTLLDIAGKFNRIVQHFSKSKLAEGLSTGILLYCIGTLSMVGPIMSALYGDNTYLFTNATLDLVTSTVLASTYGFGMILAAPVLFLFQGSIYLITSLAGDVISEELMNEISIVGGVLIASSGLAILEIKDCKTLNMLPSLAVPVFFFIAKYMIVL